MVSNNRRLALASLFGAVIFVTLGFLPAPTADFLIAVEAFFLCLSFLVVGRGGATYVGIVAGLLISVTKFSFFPLDLVFATLFGLAIDATGLALRAKVGNVTSTARLVVAATISTTVVGFLAYYVSVVLTGLLPNDAVMDSTIIVFGIFSGAVGGYAAARVWNGYLRVRVQ
jgi:hypothetical protein